MKVVHMESATTFTNAIYECSKENASLAPVHCSDVEGLGQGIWKGNGDAEFWVGDFGGGLESYPAKRITDRRRADKKFISSIGYALRRSSCTKITDASFASPKKGFLSYENGNKDNGKVKFNDQVLLEDNKVKGYICWAEEDWNCPTGYFLFQEECYRLTADIGDFPKALHECQKDNGFLAEPLTILHMTFLASIVKHQAPDITAWTGFRKNIENKTDSTDIIFQTSNYLSTDFVPSGISGT